MLICKDFVFVHMPKTGGSFVAAALKNLSKRDEASPIQEAGQKHSTCSEIPTGYTGLPILSCIRSPYEWYCSQYAFAWWKRIPEYDMSLPLTPVGAAMMRTYGEASKKCKDFPNISFADFIEWCFDSAAACGLDSIVQGLFTYSFISYFSRNPEELLARSSHGQLTHDELQCGLHNIHFLRTESLNKDLYGFLVAQGRAPGTIRFILESDRLLPLGLGRKPGESYHEVISPSTKTRLRNAEHKLFDLFPEYDT